MESTRKVIAVANDRQTEDPRRQFLIQMLSLGALTALPPQRLAQAASLLGKVPVRLPAGRSVYDLDGQVLVNGKPATADTRIGPNDTIETGPGGRAVFVVGQDAFLLRDNSKLMLAPPQQKGQEERKDDSKEGLAHTISLLAGKLLAVFGKTEHRVRTPLAVAGIRGTGVYVETDPEQTYFCTCYGTVELASATDANSRETIVSEHHDSPRYILAKPGSGGYLRPASFVNHTDPELALIESLVGRSLPFVFSDEDYVAPRREY